jgi:hypothetical protein
LGIWSWGLHIPEIQRIFNKKNKKNRTNSLAADCRGLLMARTPFAIAKISHFGRLDY